MKTTTRRTLGKAIVSLALAAGLALGSAGAASADNGAGSHGPYQMGGGGASTQSNSWS